MKKERFSIALLMLLTSLYSCGQSSVTSQQTDSISSSSLGYEETELTKIFERLKENNFTYSVTFDQTALESTTYSQFFYTPYSFQTSGSYGEEGIAQDDGFIFRYSYSNGVIKPSTPTINSSTGVRYSSIYEFTYSLENFDISKLPTTKDEEGYYVYNFNENISNDQLIMPVFFREDPASLPPESLKMKVVGNTLELQGVILANSDGSNPFTMEGYVTDIGSTENTLIKEYLDEGKSSLKSLDKRFLNFINPFFYSHNYTVDFDATSLRENGQYLTFNMTEKDTDTGVYYIPHYTGGGTPMGYFEYLGAVHKFNVINDKLSINQTVVADSEGNFYETIFGSSGMYNVTMTELSFSNLVGYKSDEDDDTYVISDDQFVYYFGDLCYISREDSRYYDYITIKILNDSTHEFEAYFDCYNKTTTEQLGRYKVHFYDVGTTKISYIDDYTSIGDDPIEDKTTLKEALDLFKGNNYSLDLLGSAGLEKIYYTENYIYQEVYGNTSNNYGFIKQGDSIYEFTITDGAVTLNTAIDYASQYNMTLPGIGSYFQANDDAQYFSKFREDDLYNLDNYTIASVGDISFYKNTASGFGQDALNYLYSNPLQDVILPGGAGFRVEKKNDDMRLTFIVSYLSSDGSMSSYYPLTFYDIGKTSNSVIDNYLNSLN